jgi:lactate dehydrogenase-like 2-hydroxyacid dehydrogenase
VSGKERVVFLDRAAFTADELPIPSFEHNWSEYPDTEAADIVPRLFWATTAITHACPIDAEAIGQLHKLKRIVVTGAARIDAEACEARGIVLQPLAASDNSGRALVGLLEAMVEAASSSAHS